MRRIWFVVSTLLLAGCAYTFNPSSIPGHIRTLEIPVADNQTLEVVLAEEMTNALSTRFVNDNTLQVVQSDADAVLECSIIGYQNRVFTFDETQTAKKYVVVLTVDMTLRDRVKGKEIWDEEGVTGTATYALDDLEGVTTEEEARVLAIKQIVDEALAKTVEGW